jgi:hypothetical protein
MRRNVDYYTWLFREKMWYWFERVLYRCLPLAEFVDFTYRLAVAENREQNIWPFRPDFAGHKPQPHTKWNKHILPGIKRVGLMNSATTSWFYYLEDKKEWVECSAEEAALLFMMGTSVSLGVPIKEPTCAKVS